METAHRLGMKTTATMMFGHVETLEERIDHLLHLRELQDRTGGFTAFIAWTFQPENTAIGGDELTSFQYLRTLAVARLMLDNFPNVQASWVTQGGEDRPGLAALRRQRLRQPDDRGERRLGGGRAFPADRGRDRPQHPGRRLRPQAPDHALRRSWAIRTAGARARPIRRPSARRPSRLGRRPGRDRPGQRLMSGCGQNGGASPGP